MENNPGCDKISLKISVASFMLIMQSNKFQDILIVGSIKIKKIFPKPAKLNINCGVDRRIGSIRHRNEVKLGSFLLFLNLLRILV